MATAHPRVNVVLDEALYKLLKKMAIRDDTSISMKARELIEMAVARYEDLYWVEVAEQRAKTFKKSKAFSHKDVWS